MKRNNVAKRLFAIFTVVVFTLMPISTNAQTTPIANNPIAVASPSPSAIPMQAKDTPKQKNTPELEYIYSMMGLVDMDYYKDVDKNELMAKMVNNVLKEHPELLDDFLTGLFSSLDEYSQFFTPEQMKAFVGAIDMSFGGIGVTVDENNGSISVMSCIDGMPAAKVGIKSGDIIVFVNGEDVSNKPMEYVVGKIRGDVGTNVSVTMKRGNENIKFELVRVEVKSDSVASAVTQDANIGYLKIFQFAPTTADEVGKALAEFDKSNVKNIILDLRNNPGGLVDSAVGVANYFVPEGIIGKAVYKNQAFNESLVSSLKQTKYNVVVLVNEGTASAAELLSSSIQDSKAGKLVGTTTYGKARIQTTYPLYARHGAKMTIGQYLTRGGKYIDKIGIEPDEYLLNDTRTFDDKDFAPIQYDKKYYIGDKSPTVLGAKQRLMILGYNVGKIDDVYSSELAEAVSSFQKDVKLFPYGVLDITTQIALYNKPFEKPITVDKQFNKAYEMLGGDLSKILLK